MKFKKLLVMGLATALFVGTVATSSAAELDLAWYAAKNPDVVAAFGNSPEMLKLHYDMFGRKEARMANSHDTEAQLRKMFNPTEYATLYPDVKAALGENAEAMFQHYMAFGLLESRRPSEKVSKETAATLKKAVEKALASAGIPALPGSAQLVAALTGEIKADVVGGAAVQQALAQVASVVEKAVVETVQKVNNPSSGGGGGSSSDSSSSKTPATVTWKEVLFGGTTRAALQAEIDKAADNTIITVSNNNVPIGDEPLVIKKNIVLNLKGNTLKVTEDGAKANQKPLIQMMAGKSLTIQNGEINCNADTKQRSMIKMASNASLTIAKNATLKGKTGSFSSGGSCGIKVEDSNVNSYVNVEGTIVARMGMTINGMNKNPSDTIVVSGTINSDGRAMYLAGNGVTTIKKGANITGNETGIEIRAGVLNIEGGTITSATALVDTGESEQTVIADDNGSTVDGAAVAVSQHVTKQNITVNITGGKLVNTAEGGVALYTTDIQGKRDDGTVNVNISGNAQLVAVKGICAREDVRNSSKPVIHDSRQDKSDEGKDENSLYTLNPAPVEPESSSLDTENGLEVQSDDALISEDSGSGTTENDVANAVDTSNKDNEESVDKEQGTDNTNPSEGNSPASEGQQPGSTTETTITSTPESTAPADNA